MKIEWFRNGFVIASETHSLTRHTLPLPWMDGWIQWIPMSKLILPLPFHPGSFQRLPTPKKWELQQITSRVPQARNIGTQSQKPEKPKIQGKARFSGSLPPRTVTVSASVAGFPMFPMLEPATRYPLWKCNMQPRVWQVSARTFEAHSCWGDP
jgi:hypothetical protein